LAQCQALKGPALNAAVASVEKRAAAEYPSLESLYKHLHAHPELSLGEEQTGFGPHRPTRTGTLN